MAINIVKMHKTKNLVLCSLSIDFYKSYLALIPQHFDLTLFISS